MSCKLVSPQALPRSIRHAMARVRLVRSRHAEDDLCQTVALALLSRSREGDGVPIAYVQAAARNTVIDHLRRKLRRAGDIALAPDTQPLSSATDPSVRVTDARVRAEVQRQLAALPDARRKAVVAYLQGETVPVIAGVLGCNRKRADNLLYRGLAQLRAALVDAGVTPACYR